jgi:DNA-binding response OmpR family regulator
VTQLPITHNATILICEEEPGLLCDLSRDLTAVGYRVVGVRGADAALELLASTRPDLILCDAELTGVDGMALLHLVRSEHPELSAVPFLILSQYDDLSDIVAGKRAGADDYLVHPVNSDFLIATIETHLRQVSRLRMAREARLQASADSAPLYHALLDQLAFGIVLFDARAQPFYVSRSAERLTGCDGASIRRWLSRHVGVLEQRSWWLQLSHNATRNCDRLQLQSTARLDGDLAGGLFVTTTELRWCDDADPAYAAMIFDPAAPIGLAGKLVADAVGLTPAESHVAQHLADGMRLDEIAAP